MVTFLDVDLDAVVRTVLVGVLAYFALVAMLRVSGKRTLSHLNAFDLVVTVALGSTLATILLSDDTGLLQGFAAFGVLIVLQFVITWSSLHWRIVARLAKSEPSVIVYRGKLLTQATRRERLLETEIEAVLREHGLATMEDADLVVLETDGSFSVVAQLDSETGDRLGRALEDGENGLTATSGKGPAAWRGR